MAGLDFLRFYGFDVLEIGKDIQIGFSGRVMLLHPDTNEAWIYIKNAKVPFMLDLPMKKDPAQWLIPLNSMLDYFGKPLKIETTIIHFSV